MPAKSKTDNTLKFLELQTLYGLVDVKITTLEAQTKLANSEDALKFLKNELSKIKPLKGKLTKLIKNY